MGNNQGTGGKSLETNADPGQAQVTQGDAAVSSQPKSPGPKKSSKQKDAKRKSKKSQGRQNSTIPIDLFTKFIRCLRDMPFDISEEQFQGLATLLQIVTLNENDVIIKKGNPGQGVYLVVGGYCKVIADDNIVLRVIEDEDFFGEISTFYKRPCTASVIAGVDETKLLWLPETELDDVIKRPVDYPLINWYINRRYLDLEQTDMQKEIIREMAMLMLCAAPPFRGWSQEAVATVADSVLKEDVVCYPAGAELFYCDEVDANGFLLLQGSIELFSGRQESLEILNAGPTGLWFGDEQLFCYSKRQTTAKTHTPCIIATFSAESFQEVTEDFPLESAKLMDLSLRWKRLVETRDIKLHEKYAGQLGVEMTRLVLRKSRLLSVAPSGMIYHVALNISYKELQKDQLIYGANQQRDKLFIVLTGAIVAESDSTVNTRRYEATDVYFPSDEEPEDLTVMAKEDSLVGICDVEMFRAVQDQYPDAIINWENA